MCAANERVARRKTTFCSRCPCCLAILALVLAVLVLAAILDAATAPTAPSPSAPLVLAHADFMRDESIAVHAASVREAITREFGTGALRVLGDSQAWFRERVRRFLKEGADPAF